METVLSLSDQMDHIVYSTTRLLVEYEDESMGTGTALYMQFTLPPGQPSPVLYALVTNKHVVQGAMRMTMIAQEAMPGDGMRMPAGRWDLYPEDSQSDELTHGWIGHPSLAVDLCALPVGPKPFADVIENVDADLHRLFFLPIGDNLIPSEDDLSRMRVVEHVMMPGYPNDLWDKRLGLPLVRHGTTASHPRLSFGGAGKGALDIAAFPGSSGSPVIQYRPDVDYSVDIRPPNHPVLLGVLSEGPLITAEGQMQIAAIPVQDLPEVETRTPMHVGYYEKASHLEALRATLLNVIGIP